MKKTLVDSEAWQKPNPGSQCVVSYTGRLAGAAGGQGAVFDERTAEEPLHFTTDEGRMPRGCAALPACLPACLPAVIRVGLPCRPCMACSPAVLSSLAAKIVPCP